MEESARFYWRANYETWAMYLWLCHDEATHRYWMEAVEEEWEHYDEPRPPGDLGWTYEHTVEIRLAYRLEKELTGTTPNLSETVGIDLEYADLSKIEWDEIAWQFVHGERLKLTLEASRKFSLGLVATTTAALRTLEARDIFTALRRHASGDWGECEPEDAEENELSLREGFRLFSVYDSASGERFWVITEADRSSTTLLLPEEY